MVNKILIIVPSVLLIIGISYILIFFPNFFPNVFKSVIEGSLLWVLVLVFTSLLIGPVVFLTYMFVPIYNKAKFYNMLYGKGHGILRLKSKGRMINNFIINFNKPWTSVPLGEKMRGLFILQDSAIYVENGVQVITFNELDAIEPMKEVGMRLDMMRDSLPPELQKIAGKSMELKIYANPVSYDKALEEIEESRDPQQLENLFMKFRSTAEAHASNVFEDFAKKYGMYFLIFAALVIGASAVGTGILMNDIQPWIPHIVGQQDNMIKLLTEIKGLMEAKAG